MSRSPEDQNSLERLRALRDKLRDAELRVENEISLRERNWYRRRAPCRLFQDRAKFSACHLLANPEIQQLMDRELTKHLENSRSTPSW